MCRAHAPELFICVVSRNAAPREGGYRRWPPSLSDLALPSPPSRAHTPGVRRGQLSTSASIPTSPGEPALKPLWLCRRCLAAERRSAHSDQVSWATAGASGPPRSPAGTRRPPAPLGRPRTHRGRPRTPCRYLWPADATRRVVLVPVPVDDLRFSRAGGADVGHDDLPGPDQDRIRLQCWRRQPSASSAMEGCDGRSLSARSGTPVAAEADENVDDDRCSYPGRQEDHSKDAYFSHER